MNNSPLVNYTKISPNKTSPRNHKIDTITIHCYVGQASVESMGDWFAQSSAQASCNYGIGSDGRIGLFVEECDRSWCSSNKANDHRAITIECASDKTDPYAINDKVYASLITLCADICKRNDIKELKWKADKSLIGQVDKQNMTVHRWFANKACPGDYIYNRLGKIAKEVNTKLGIVTTEPTVDENNYKTLPIGNSTVEDVAKVVYGEAGILKSRQAFIAVAQCIHDMLDSGIFGDTIVDIMKRNFSAYGTTTTTDEACEAVHAVFYKNERRFKDAQLLQFRSFTKYSDGNGNIDRSKCADLLKKYDYLGKDALNDHWGHLYFGHKSDNAVDEPATKTLFRVRKSWDDSKSQIGAFYDLDNAKKSANTEPGYSVYDENGKTVYTSKVRENPTKTFEPYQVRVSIDYLRIRKAAGLDKEFTGKYTGRGVFTIVDEATASDNSKWGLLKSYEQNRDGWISLQHTTKI